MYYAVIFKKEFEPGDHWDVRARPDDPDRLQHWKKGELYSHGSVIADPLPFHLEAIPITGPPQYGETWDVEKRAFVPHADNKRLVQEQIDHHQSEIERLKALL